MIFLILEVFCLSQCLSAWRFCTQHFRYLWLVTFLPSETRFQFHHQSDWLLVLKAFFGPVLHLPLFASSAPWSLLLFFSEQHGSEWHREGGNSACIGWGVPPVRSRLELTRQGYLAGTGGLEVLILQVLCVILMCWAFIGEGSRKILNLCEPLLQVLARMPRTARKATNHLSFQWRTRATTAQFATMWRVAAFREWGSMSWGLQSTNTSASRRSDLTCQRIREHGRCWYQWRPYKGKKILRWNKGCVHTFTFTFLSENVEPWT